MTPKPYKLTRRYLTHDGTVKTYEQNMSTLDQVYNSITHAIAQSDSYTFVGNKIVLTHNDSTKLTIELHNQLKPCIIPIIELLDSHHCDTKYTPE